MAQNVQNVTLSLTLPITCHICLGKVRQPVICVNYHVFCSVCIEVWLKNNNHCPACRVPITPENPCKEIIGGTGENECVFTHTVRKHLRKTRLELLHKEYEDEIESLEKEVDELKGKNLSLESQLKIVLDPQSLTASTENDGSTESADKKSSIDPKTLEKWTKKLKAANEISMKMKDDVEKFKEVNKKLRTENSSFVRENMRLKAEVDSRSPQKFGRFTVAALQSKVDQHEREANRLKKALERSDAYIEELESQVIQLKRTIEENKSWMTSRRSVEKESDDSEEGTSLKSQEEITQETILSASQSSDNIEQPSLSGLQDDSMICLNSSSQENSNGSESHCLMDKEMCSGSQGLPDAATEVMPTTLRQTWENKLEDCTPNKDVSEFPTQGTPTMSLSSLQLNTPNDKDSPCKGGKMPSTYLRKLTFDEFPCEMTSNDNGDSTKKHESGSVHEPLAYDAKSKTMLWNCSRTNYDKNYEFESSDPALEFDRSDQSVSIPQPRKRSLSSDKACQFLFERLQAITDAEINCSRTTSEASMDAAYLDKITELDSMMSESESSKSPYRFRLADLANTSKCSQRSKLCETEKALEQTKVNTEKCSESSNETSNSEEWKPIAFAVLSPSSLHINENFPLFADENSETDEVTSQKCCFEKDQPSPTFLFESQNLDDDLKSESTLFNVCAEETDPLVQCQASWTSSFLPKERSRSNSNSTKRKIQSSISSASPSKSSKS